MANTTKTSSSDAKTSTDEQGAKPTPAKKVRVAARTPKKTKAKPAAKKAGAKAKTKVTAKKAKKTTASKKTAKKAASKVARKATRKTAKTPTAKRYSAEEKKEILDFVRAYNSKKGRGGQSQAVKKYGISPITVANWLKGGKKSKGSPGRKPGRKAAKVTKSAGSSATATKIRRLADKVEGFEALEKKFTELSKEFASVQKEMDAIRKAL